MDGLHHPAQERGAGFRACSVEIRLDISGYPERRARHIGMTIEAFDTAGVRGFLHRPLVSNGDAIALTHGAGSDANAPLLVRMASAFAEAGFVVLRYDLPYRIARATGPPSPATSAQDREGIVRAAEALRQFSAGRVFAGGHSYGGRQTAMAAAEHTELASALLLFSYPLHPPRKRDRLRTGFFPDLRPPALFIHGTRDPFGSIEELRAAIAAIPARTDLLAIEGAGHELDRAPAAAILARFQALVCYPEK